MKILIGNNGNVDLDGPVEMNEEQYQRFLSFMKSIFEVLSEAEPESIERDRLGERLFMKPWEDEEYTYILDPTLTTEELTKMLGRTWMSINIKRGWYMADFNRWCREKGKQVLREDSRDLITQFIKEKRELFNTKKQEKKEISRIKQNILNMVDEGCKIGTDVYGPECVNAFHNGCLTCPFGRSYIKTKADIDKFNQVYDEVYT